MTIISSKTAAKYLDGIVTEKTLRNWAKDGIFPDGVAKRVFVKTKITKVLFIKEKLDEWLASEDAPFVNVRKRGKNA